MTRAVRERAMGADRVNSEPRLETQPRHLLHVFPSFSIGGAQIRFVQLAKAHGPRYRHTVVSLDDRFDMAAAIPASVAWAPLRLRDFDKRAGLQNIRTFRELLRQTEPDLLITYNWGTIEWCLADRLLPVVNHCHIEDGFGREERDRQLLRRTFTRRIALSGRHTRVIVPSKTLQSIALNQWHLPRRNLIYIPNGVDCSRFVPEIGAPKGENDPIVIGAVSGLRPEKRIDRLIEAFASVRATWPNRPLKLVIVGDGPERARLETAAGASAVAHDIVFSGATDTPERLYRDFDIFALSSDTEQMPLSVLEAMACGLPIASVAVGDVAEMVSEPNKPFVVGREAPGAFEAAIEALVTNPRLRRHVGEANRETALARFSHARMVARYAELFG